MTHPLVSVIIPVYKVEKYLNQCVDSVLAQTYQNFEIILVDDGSPDNSGAICDDYAAKDNRIRVIHKENGGASSARNVGLREARGEYVQFLDSDDYLCNNKCVEKLINKMSEGDYDFVLFKTLNGYTKIGKYVDNDGDFDIKYFETGDKTEIFRYMVKCNKPLASAHNKMVRRDTLTNNAIYFEEGIVGEDIDWIIKLFRHSKKISAVNEVFHIYRVDNTNSVTSNVSNKMIWDNYGIIREYAEFGKKGADEFSKGVLSYMAFVYATLLCNIAVHGDIVKFKEVEKYDWLFKYAIDKKTKLVRFIYRLFGFENGIKIIGKVRENWKKIQAKRSRQ